MERMNQEAHHGGSSHGSGSFHRDRSYMATRQAKIDFPQFDGSDLNDWLFRCCQFFEIDGTPTEMKMKWASINLEGHVLSWH